MAVSSTADWSRLPSVIIVDILAILPLKDRLNASTTCSRWRQCLFHPSMWRNIELNLDNEDECARANFLSARCGNFARNFCLEWPDDFAASKNALAVLQRFGRNRNLTKFCLNVCNSEFDDETLDGFIDTTEDILLNSKKLKYLSLGYIHELCDSELLYRIGDNCGTSLTTLHLASLLPDDSTPGIEPHCLRPFKNLQVLSLNYDDLTSDLFSVLAQPHRVKLQHLLVLADGLESDKPKVLDSMWQDLVAYNPQMKVILTLLSVHPSEIMNIFRPSMPLSTLRIMYSGPIPRSTMDFISAYNSKTLEALYLHEHVDSDEPPNLLFPDVEGVEDPLVMLAWRCYKLSYLSIIGYEVMDENLIAIARLRGPKLKTFEVLSDYIVDQTADENYGATEELIKQISHSLGKTWSPLESVEEPTFPAILKSDLLISAD
ncbi:F-box only protein 33-like [Ptychodera flava]|uniref:F-box only protein 33-like n=1 Tax=Ptychodera flava TaxID=63121 RepID=UPI00396A0CDD